MKKLKYHPFKGKITEISNGIAMGGKPYYVEITLDDGSKAYIMNGGFYMEIDRSLECPIGRWCEAELLEGSPVNGQYIVYEKMKIVMQIEFPESVRDYWIRLRKEDAEEKAEAAAKMKAEKEERKKKPGGGK